MNRILNLFIISVIILLSSGCASYLSYQASQNEIIGQRVVASGDDMAIKAFRSGNTVGIGINVLATDTLTKHPMRQLGAALLDLAMMYGTYEGVKSLDDGGSENDDRSVAVSGDNNNVTIIDDSTNTDVDIERDRSTP